MIHRTLPGDYRNKIVANLLGKLDPQQENINRWMDQSR